MTEAERAQLREFFKARADQMGADISDERLDALVDGFIERVEEEREKYQR